MLFVERRLEGKLEGRGVDKGGEEEEENIHYDKDVG